MKQVTALIKPHMEGKVVSALHELPEFPGFTIIERVRGQGRGRGVGGGFVATELNLTFQMHAMLVVVCRDELVGQVCGAIIRNAHTGHKGDGIIWVVEAGNFHRIGEFSETQTAAGSDGDDGSQTRRRT